MSEPSFTCPRCGITSHNPNDVDQGYCGRCHDWTGSGTPSLYPPGYRDPDWDGTEAGFRDVVLPARMKAIEQGANERFADVLPEGMRFEWVTK